ncbi:MAG: hypothetical protein ACOVNU_04255 [Candidatus Kapaibacteriota bacterium]
MNPNTKKFVVIFGVGILLFIAFKKLRPYGVKGKKGGSSKVVATNDQKKNAAIIVKAYTDAINGGEDKSFLNDMNAEFTKTYGMRVISEKSSGQHIATDLQGNKIV